jgi:hypothetical protein
MAATHGLAAILRDARKKRAPQDEVGNKFHAKSFTCCRIATPRDSSAHSRFIQSDTLGEAMALR